MPRKRLAAALPGLMLLLPDLAQAHAGGSDTGLIDGLMHPVFGLDHLLAMISVGVVSAQLGGNNIWRIPAVFVGAMTMSAMLGLLQVTVPYVEVGIAASVLVLGVGIVFADPNIAPWPITALVLLFGACHGYLHGVEIPQSVSPTLYTMGFVISTSVLHLFGVIIGEVATMQKWLWRGLRLIGATVAALGVAFLLQTILPIM